MKNTIKVYLLEKLKKCKKSKRLNNRFSIPAITYLLASRALETQDWPKLKELISDLKHENNVTIEVAKKHSDVFHPNVILSRKIENRKYDRVLRMIKNAIKNL